MVAINMPFSSDELQPKTSIFHVPSGEYLCMLTGVRMDKALMDGKPDELVFDGFVKQGGEHQGKVFEIRLNINDNSTGDDSIVPNTGGNLTWKKLAYIKLMEISIAAGLKDIPSQDLTQLTRKDIVVKFVEKKGRPVLDKQTKQPKLDSSGKQEYYPDRAEPRSYKPAPQVAAQSAPPVQQAQQPTNQYNADLDDEIPF